MSVECERPKEVMDSRFSPSEVRLLNLLPQDGTKIDTLELTRKFYSDREAIPVYARITIGGLIRALVDKTYDFRRGFRVMRSERQGPKPILIWLEILPSMMAKAKARPARAKVEEVKAKLAKAKEVEARPAKLEEVENRPQPQPQPSGKLARESRNRGKPKILDKPKARREARKTARRARGAEA